MQFSVWPSIERPVDELVEVARWADRAGWHGFWFADHYMADTADGSPSHGPAHECWSLLPYIAAVTDRLRIGPLVSPTTVHHPALLAKRAATIDHLSNGRFVLGLGAGWQVNEHRAYGIELPPIGTRVERFAEALEIVRRLLDDRSVDHAGRHFSLSGAPCEPKPVQDRLPILVGTGGPRMMRLTSRFADEWNTWGDAAEVARRTEHFLRACELEQRDPATMHRSAQALLFFTDAPGAAERIKARTLPDRTFQGTPDQIAEQLRSLASLGVDEFVLRDVTLGDDRAERQDAYERFAAEVVPLV